MLAVAAAGLVALFGVLAVPVVFVIDAERAATLKTTWRVRWLYGLVDIESDTTKSATSRTGAH